MTFSPVLLGRVAPPGMTVARSGVRWLIPDGHVCQRGELIAYCNIAVAGHEEAFPDEHQDLQIALASPATGRLHQNVELSEGGYVDRLPAFPWQSDLILAHLEGGGNNSLEARPLYLAAKRFVEVSGDRSGLLAGWHKHVRAWWGDRDIPTLIAAGTCEQAAILRSGENAFADLFAESDEGRHIVITHDEPLVPNARTFVEAMRRTPEDFAAIRKDLAETFPTAEASSADLLFIGALLGGLEKAPLAESHSILTGSGLQRLGSVQALALSLGAEFAQALRHRALGYTVNCHHYRLAQTGIAVKAWLRANFRLIDRSVDDVRRDYEELLAQVAGRTRLVVTNMFSSQSYQRATNYALPNQATFNALGTVRAKRLNLMLHDLSQQYDLHVVDQDALAANMGMALHVRDGTHPSGRLNRQVRHQIVDLAFPD